MKRAKLLEMEEYIRFRQTISLKELQDHFDVSINTVRRYIATILESNPDIKKVYGGVTVETGAVPRGNAVFHPYSEAPEIQNVSEKQRLCRYAASRIRAHDIIYIDNGTTTSFIPFYIPDELPLTIITNSVNIINAVIKKPNITLATLPGILNRATMSFTGDVYKRQGILLQHGVQVAQPQGRLDVHAAVLHILLGKQPLQVLQVREPRRLLVQAPHVLPGHVDRIRRLPGPVDKTVHLGG